MGRAYIRRGLSTEGNLRFQIDWASLIVGSKLTVFALLYFVFEGNFPSTSSRGAYIWRGDLTEGFLRCRFGGRIFGGAYTRRGVFSEFYGMIRCAFLISRIDPNKMSADFDKRQEISPCVFFPKTSLVYRNT